MKSKKLLNLIILIVGAYILPISVFAKTYSFHDATDNIIFEAGDIIDFSDAYDYYSDKMLYLYLDGELISQDCYGRIPNCNLQFSVQQRMALYNYDYETEEEKLFFYKMEPSQEVIVFDDSIMSGYYKTGDIIFFKTESFGKTAYFYDNNDNLLNELVFGTGHRNLIYRLPKVNDKNMYWRLSVFDDGTYHNPCPHLTSFEYTEPKIELKCDKDKINYGEKTRCEVYLESPYKMSNLNFLINHNHLKLSNISYLDGVTNSGNDNQIMKLSFDDNNSFTEKKVIMTFDVEGTKDSSYLDNISLENIEYTDEVVTAKYENLNSDLNILSTKPLTNPETGMKALFVVIPIFILLIVSGMSTIGRKKHEK